MRDNRSFIARRAAEDLPDGAYINLGIGIPTLVPALVPAGVELIYQSENGILGMGPPPLPGLEDGDLINASKDFTTLLPGAAICDSCQAFSMMRGGHIDIALMGAFEVAANGDLANWSLDRQGTPPGVGGAMDLAIGAREVWVLMEHVGNAGQLRIVDRCRLPVTAFAVVTRIYTQYATMDVKDGTIFVRSVSGDIGRDQLQDMTGAQLVFSED